VPGGKGAGDGAWRRYRFSFLLAIIQCETLENEAHIRRLGNIWAHPGHSDDRLLLVRQRYLTADANQFLVGTVMS
jgi:hypothetical protein